MKMNKKTGLLLLLLALAGPRLLAQNLEEEGTGEIEHTGIETQVDSALLGRDIFSVLPGHVIVRQDPAVREALARQVESNAERNYSGFRIRLYFASNRTAREESAAVIRRFDTMYPNIQAYRTYASPNFKVTVGNFRTRLDAEALLRKLKADFPDAFIVRERFKYPSVGRADARPSAPIEEE